MIVDPLKLRTESVVMATILCIDDDLRVLETQKSLLEKNGTGS